MGLKVRAYKAALVLLHWYCLRSPTSIASLDNDSLGCALFNSEGDCGTANEKKQKHNIFLILQNLHDTSDKFVAQKA